MTRLEGIKKKNDFDINMYRLGDIICSTKLLLASLSYFLAKTSAAEAKKNITSEFNQNIYYKDKSSPLARSIQNKVSKESYITALNFYPDLFNIHKQLCPKSKVLKHRICMLFLLLIKDLNDRKASCDLKSILKDSGSRGIDNKLIDQKLMEVKKYQDKYYPDLLFGSFNLDFLYKSCSNAFYECQDQDQDQDQDDYECYDFDKTDQDLDDFFYRFGSVSPEN